MAAEAKALWAKADAVCFDVDSTVCVDEGIDEFAAHLGKKEAVAAWTAKAMGGGVTFEEALAARLDIMRPTYSELQEFLAKNPPKLSPGIKELVSALQAKNVAVYLISGGFTQMVHPVADLLSIPRANVHANTFLFKNVPGKGNVGDYDGFDTKAFTSRSGGKPACLKHLKEQYKYKTLAMVGDGATDLEAKQPGAADVFIGYGGVQKRDVVVKNSDWFVTSFAPLIDIVAARPAAKL
eukprot:TRINITY_DN38025_c0_g1_i1.p1 TRINITY_DN38025_c0_g1~~TRINITY_DN38025_c0_g1_i1.p1  ORF type:complete len:254 (+),score=87.84 TRINITY_DN38025_c0_g1_i1:49-762(+)